MKTSVMLRVIWSILILPLAISPLPLRSAAPFTEGTRPASAKQQRTIIWVGVDRRIDLSKLHPGSSIEGALIRAVYWRDHEVFRAGSRVRLIVERIDQGKKAPLPDDRPFVLRLFAPRHGHVPAFRSASITLPDGSSAQIHAIFLGLMRKVKISAAASESRSRGRKSETYDGRAGADGRRSKEDRSDSRTPDVRQPAQVLVLEVEPSIAPFPQFAAATTGEDLGSLADSAESATVPAGTRVPLVLLEPLSASKNHVGDSLQARVLEPVRVGSRVIIPEGSVLDGFVVKRIPPRRLNRPGVLHVTFTKLTLPRGEEAKIAAAPASAETDKSLRIKMDSEGALRGGNLNKARFLLDVGVASGVAKATDDFAQLLLELLISSATDASTAGVGRIVAACTSGLFLVTRHGRDVVLPKYTEMDVIFNRPVSLAERAAPGNAERSTPSEPAPSPSEP